MQQTIPAQMTQPAILLTRPGDGAGRFADALRARLGAGVVIVTSPVLEIVPTGAMPQMADGALPVFTSRQGVAHCGLTGSGPCYTVGDATARAAEAAGFTAISADGDVEALLARILADAPDRPLIHLRGEPASGDLVGRLRRAGLPARDCVVYRQAARALSAQALALLDGEKPVVLPLFSPQSAAQFSHAHRGRAPLLVVAISDKTAEAASNLVADRVIVAAKPDMDAMRDAVIGLFDAGELLETGESAD